MGAAQNYPLGYSAQEAQRLADQAAVMEQHTEDVLRRAGIRRGMRVLDVGSGLGDVSLLAARIVGCDGAVLGIDRAASSVEAARQRVASLGLTNVCFQHSDLAGFSTQSSFDALVGRFVLAYVSDRASQLHKLTRHLNPGAVVVFQEVDMTEISQSPPSELFTRVRRWILDAFAASGTELAMGTKLHETFVQAGLPAPSMTAATPVVGGSSSMGYEQSVDVLRSLLPTIEQHGMATAAEIDIETLAERLRADAARHGRVLFLSRIVAAWAQLAHLQ